MGSPPPEVLARIFDYLEPHDLDVVPLVCKKWWESSGEKLWKRHFVQAFGTRDISFISGQESSWREEYLARLEVLHRWKRHNLNTVSYNPTLGTITDLFADLSMSRVIAFNRGRGMGNMSDPRVGKVARERLVAVDFPLHQRVACVDSSRFAIICGFPDGRLQTMVFARSSHVILSYNRLDCRHNDEVTSVWVSKTTRPHSNGPPSFVSGGGDGQVFLIGSRTDSFHAAQLSSHPIQFVQGGEETVAIDTAGEVFWLDPTGQVLNTARFPQHLPPNTTQIFIFGDYIIAKLEKCIYRLTKTSCVKFSLPSDHIRAWNVDRSTSQGPKYMVAAVSGGTLYCWRIDLPCDTEIPLFWTRPAPFVSDRQPEVTQVALNSVVLLVGGYNGHCIAMDLMAGEVLRQVSSKLSRQVLDFRRGDAAGRQQFAISHLEIDPDPLQPHAVLTVKEAVQYIDSGADSGQIKPLRKSRRGPISRAIAERHTAVDMQEEIDFNMEMIVLEDEHQDQQTQLRQDFAMNNMSEEEQVAYAVLLSEQNPDDELSRALELSLQPAPPAAPAQSDDDEELRRALDRSLVEQ